MARHRVNDTYLSDEEYAKHINDTWAGWIFLFSSIISGFLAYEFLVNPAWDQIARFATVLIVALVSGAIFSALSKIIRIIVSIGIGITILGVVASFVWDAV